MSGIDNYYDFVLLSASWRRLKLIRIMSDVVEVVGSHFEDLFETNTAPIRPPPRPPLQPRTEYATTPIIKVSFDQ